MLPTSKWNNLVKVQLWVMESIDLANKTTQLLKIRLTKTVRRTWRLNQAQRKSTENMNQPSMLRKCLAWKRNTSATRASAGAGSVGGLRTTVTCSVTASTGSPASCATRSSPCGAPARRTCGAATRSTSTSTSATTAISGACAILFSQVIIALTRV